MGVLVRSVALGLAAGGRSAVAVAVPVHAATRGHHGPAARALRGLTTVAVLGEMVTDKLPATPSRLVPVQIGGRIVAGATGAAALAVVDRRGPGAVLVAVLAGGAGAFAGSVGGASWRQWAAEQGPDVLRPDVRAALVEDALVLVTARTLAHGR
ncbi:hypothetical protein J1G44_08640 [Cellulomonas sp. zg-ZUI199]|uniref:DUF4126 domain-containing protein n=1 Tax=Cellulomonas wangleii TaxID=2816956 RepID=A0ABX8D533_9CELL|nr:MULTISPECIES: hypothetical protein [Cellulomonas]MBO0898441.1 hypothetical protein [Cellulomonas sp. zg-ZUI22]MBO0924549.1 hypothetical protein [Cellulomonas wangleii]QVI62534.1 hypothetical protein KG103_00820 [Cellulomonas wangleii]